VKQIEEVRLKSIDRLLVIRSLKSRSRRHRETLYCLTPVLSIPKGARIPVNCDGRIWPGLCTVSFPDLPNHFMVDWKPFFIIPFCLEKVHSQLPEHESISHRFGLLQNCFVQTLYELNKQLTSKMIWKLFREIFLKNGFSFKKLRKIEANQQRFRKTLSALAVTGGKGVAVTSKLRHP